MEERGSAKDKYGRTWKAKVLSMAEAEEEDFRFWFEELSPEDRVNTVNECLTGCLKTKGGHGTKRLRRVFRVIKLKRP